MKSKNQMWLFNPNMDYANKKIVIVWVWWVGSVSTYYLSQMWCNNITVIDMDEVEIHNTMSQFYKASDVWKLKTDALQKNIKDFNEINVNVINWEYNKSMIEWADIVISAVDNMDIRKTILDDCLDLNIEYFIEARMSWEVFMIFTINPFSQYEDWLSMRYPSSEADPEICTMKSISYNTWFIGSYICKITRDILMDKTPPFMVSVNLEDYSFTSV